MGKTATKMFRMNLRLFYIIVSESYKKVNSENQMGFPDSVHKTI